MPLAVCIGFAALAFGGGLVVRFLKDRTGR